MGFKVDPDKIEVTKNSYGYYLSFTLQDNDGDPVDISGKTISINLATKGASTYSTSGTLSIIDGESGTCRYLVAGGDFDTGKITLNSEIVVSGSGEFDVYTGPDVYVIDRVI